MSKKLSDRVQEAIDWIASEYKFLQDLHYRLSILSKFYIAKLALINRTSDEQRRRQLQKELVQEANLHKSLVVARYIGKAERRANRPIHDILKALHEVHDSNIDKIARDVDIPNKLFECAFAGLPIIASNTTELRKAVKNFNLGTTFKPGSHTDLAEKILKLIKGQSKENAKTREFIQEMKFENAIEHLLAEVHKQIADHRE